MNIAEKLDGLSISTSSPDGRIQSVLEGQTKLRLEFRPGGYAGYTERDLEHQLARLATLTWTGYRRAYTDVVTAAGLDVVLEPGDEWNSRDRQYQEERLQVEGRGESPSGHVRARSLALLRWQIKIRDGALRKLSEAEFSREVLGAVGQAIRDYRTQSTKLREEYFGSGLFAGQ